MKTYRNAELDLDKFLAVIDGIHVAYWTCDDTDDEPLWTGWCTETPFWIAQSYKIKNFGDDADAFGEPPISFRQRGFGPNKDLPGLCIWLVDKDEK